MTNPDHVQLIEMGIVEVEKFQALGGTLQLAGHDFSGKSLAGYGFAGADFTNAVFDKTDLSNAHFSKCMLDGASFREACSPGTRVTFNACSIDRVNFRNAHVGLMDLQNTTADAVDFSNSRIRANWEFCKLSNCIFIESVLVESVFFRCAISGGRFAGAKLARVQLKDVDLLGVDLSGADLFEIDLYGGAWHDVKGLNYSKRLESVKVSLEPKCVADYATSGIDKVCDWERLRTFGRIPMFGLSYSVLILIPAYIFLITWYNSQVDNAKEWRAFREGWIGEHLHHLPLPTLSLMLLASTLLLAIASTIYALACPSRIKEFSQDVWCDQFKYSRLTYLPIAWRHRKLRVICGFCYVFGGAGAIFVLLAKVFRVGIYIVEHTSL